MPRGWKCELKRHERFLTMIYLRVGGHNAELSASREHTWPKGVRSGYLMRSGYILHSCRLLTVSTLQRRFMRLLFSASLERDTTIHQSIFCHRHHCAHRIRRYIYFIQGRFWGFSPSRTDMMHGRPTVTYQWCILKPRCQTGLEAQHLASASSSWPRPRPTRSGLGLKVLASASNQNITSCPISLLIYLHIMSDAQAFIIHFYTEHTHIIYWCTCLERRLWSE